MAGRLSVRSLCTTTRPSVSTIRAGAQDGLAVNGKWAGIQMKRLVTINLACILLVGLAAGCALSAASPPPLHCCSR